MPQLGSDNSPVRMSAKSTIKIRGQYIKNENRQKYEDNYDRIFGRKENRNEEKKI